MKKNNLIIIGSIIIILVIVGIIIGLKDNLKVKNEIEVKNDLDNIKGEEIDSMKVIIDNKEYIINLEDNKTVKSFINMLPLELNMNELNGNEKYVYLDKTLPTNSYNPKRINTGDVMLYGNNCLVIFYKSFDTTYSYTKIGHIDNLPNLGNNNILVRFEK